MKRVVPATSSSFPITDVCGCPVGFLERYQDIRRDRTSAVVRKAHENRAQAFSPELADEDAVAISVAREWQQVRLRERMDWLYAYDATAVQI